MPAARRTGVGPGLHFILDPLQPSNAAAFKFSQMGCGEASIHIEINWKK